MNCVKVGCAVLGKTLVPLVSVHYEDMEIEGMGVCWAWQDVGLAEAGIIQALETQFNLGCL